MANEKFKIAWVDDDKDLLSENIFYLLDTSNNRFYFDVFRKNFDISNRKNGYLDLKLAKESLIKYQHYDGIILDDYLLGEEIYPLDKKPVGAHLLKDIRSNPINKHTPIIMYTDENEFSAIKIYRKLGADIWVPKSPFRYLQDDIKDKFTIFKKNPEAVKFIEMIQSLRRIREK